MSGHCEPFVLLADPHHYQACDWDLSVDPDGRAYWVPFFIEHFRKTILKLAIEAADARGKDVRTQAEQCTQAFETRMNAFAERPTDFGRVTVIILDRWRDETLRAHNFPDAFAELKHRENERMLPLLPIVCQQLHAIADPHEQFRAMIEGVFAGNIFDMGATATANAFLDHSPDFFTTRRTLAPRPWLIDDYDALQLRILHGPPHKKVVFFIDNAGSDFLLGALPMMRFLARRGAAISLAANQRPSLNDMTIDDVKTWWPRILQAEPSFAHLNITQVSTGTGEPLIDLSEVSPELSAAAANADLLILEGMGRSVESNFDARFTCDTLKIAMLKDTIVARRLGGKIFDCVCKFESAPSDAQNLPGSPARSIDPPQPHAYHPALT